MVSWVGSSVKRRRTTRSDDVASPKVAASQIGIVGELPPSLPVVGSAALVGAAREAFIPPRAMDHAVRARVHARLLHDSK